MRVLLDTVTFVYMLERPEKLSRRATSVIENPGNILDLSVLSVAEIALKGVTGKLNLGRNAVMEAADRLKLNVLPYLQEHALELFGLPLLHRDPFDRQLIAQALVENIPIVTCDEQFTAYKGLRIIW
jgi:PIN domain nuclease of toxin-antitoxin system